MTKPIKVVHLVPGLGIGGTEKQVRLLLTHLDKTRWDVQLWALKKDRGPLGDRLMEKGIPVKTFGGHSWKSSIWLLPKLWWELIRQKPDILHTWLTPANAIGRLAAKLARGHTRIVSSLRVVEKRKWPYFALESRTQLSKAITVNARAVLDFAQVTLKIPASKLVLIPNAWQEEPPNPQSTINLPMDWLKPDIHLIGAAGRLDEQKGFPILLKAFERIHFAFPNARLIIAGEGPLKNNLKKQIKELSLKGRVILLGALPDLEDFFARIRLFVLSSLWEGMPNVLIEAMAHGVPIVATKVGGVEELVTHGKTGILVSENDEMALMEGIRQTILKPEEARARSVDAKSIIRTQYSLPQSIRLTENLYKDLLEDDDE